MKSKTLFSVVYTVDQNMLTVYKNWMYIIHCSSYDYLINNIVSFVNNAALTS